MEKLILVFRDKLHKEIGYVQRIPETLVLYSVFITIQLIMLCTKNYVAQNILSEASRLFILNTNIHVVQNVSENL
jgi:ketopantoate reductase